MSPTATYALERPRAPYGAEDYVRARDWRADDVPDDVHARLKKRLDALTDVVPEKPAFVHVPTITLMRGGVPQHLRGPAAPAKIKVTQETQIGWEKWADDRLQHAVGQAADAKARAAFVHAYFEKRAAKKKADAHAMFQRACERLNRAGRPVPTREEWDRERFERGYERACAKAVTAGLVPPTRKQHAEPKPGWEMYVNAPEFMAAMRAAKLLGRNKRRRERYVFKGGMVAGRKTAPFVEEMTDGDGNPSLAFRTAINICFELFNSSLPKGVDVTYGNDKTTVYNALLDGSSRMDVLDKEYIEADRVRRCLFVVDLDGWWTSLKALWKALRAFLPPEFMPNLAVYRAREDGKGIENPHLLWLLPPGSRVIPRSGAKHIAQQRKLHQMIQRGIVNHLIDVGADPCHHNSDKMKNPISPKWSAVCNDDHFATMAEWKAFLPTITPDERSMRARAKKRKIEIENDVEAELSNAIWRDGISARTRAIKAAQRRQDPAFEAAIKSHEGFVAWLYHPVTGAVVTRMLELHGDGPVVRQILAAQEQGVVEFNRLPSFRGQFHDRGRDHEFNRHRERGFKPECAEEREQIRKARQSGAGTLSRSNEKAINCGLIAEEIERRLALGITIEEIQASKAEIVKTLVSTGNASRPTAYRRFDEVVEIVSQAARYQAVLKLGKEIEPSSSQPSQVVSDQTGLSATPASGSVVQSTLPSAVRRPFQPVDPAVMAGRLALRTLESWRRAVSAWRDAFRRRQDPDEMTLPSPTVSSAFWSTRRH